MSLRKKYAMLVGSASLALLLVACGGESNDGGNGGAETEETTSEETGEEAGQEGEGSGEDSGGGDQAASVPEFESTVSNEGDPIDGGVAQVGIVSDTAWTGIFDHQLYQINTDSTIGSYFLGNLLTQDENFALVGGEEWGTAADIEFDEDNATATITVRDGVYWHDGEQVTADDVVFAHEIIGDPDYTGIRYGDEFTNIEGMEEFKAGEADSISGLELSEDQMSVTIHYKDFNPKMTQAGGGRLVLCCPKTLLG